MLFVGDVYPIFDADQQTADGREHVARRVRRLGRRAAVDRLRDLRRPVRAHAGRLADLRAHRSSGGAGPPAAERDRNDVPGRPLRHGQRGRARAPRHHRASRSRARGRAHVQPRQDRPRCRGVVRRSNRSASSRRTTSMRCSRSTPTASATWATGCSTPRSPSRRCAASSAEGRNVVTTSILALVNPATAPPGSAGADRGRVPGGWHHLLLQRRRSRFRQRSRPADAALAHGRRRGGPHPGDHQLRLLRPGGDHASAVRLRRSRSTTRRRSSRAAR